MRVIATFIFLILFDNFSFGQLNQHVGQILITDSLLQFEIKNDSLLDISLNRLWCKYSIKNDTLTLKSNEKFEDGSYLNRFKILTNNSDSLFLIPVIITKQQVLKTADTLKFISVKKRLVALNSFNSIRIDEYGTWGSKRLVIKKDRIVQFSNRGYYLPNEPATDMKQFSISEKEYKKIIDTLTKSLILMLPYNKRALHGYDPTFIDISYDINGNSVILKDIGLSKLHWLMYKYLMYEAFKNK
ncbi:MAG: hypothetical protein JSR97_01900 [Verrucomicrobia bacterium]|nr:hypothetical protein [Verrucomicrobiota bacterium]